MISSIYTERRSIYMATDEKVYSLVKVPVCDNCGHRFEKLEYRTFVDRTYVLAREQYRFKPNICPRCGKHIISADSTGLMDIVRVHVLM